MSLDPGVSSSRSPRRPQAAHGGTDAVCEPQYLPRRSRDRAGFGKKPLGTLIALDRIMTSAKRPLSDLEPADLDAAAGGHQPLTLRTEGRPLSKNVLDCRGDTCTDWTGETDVEATLQHKHNVGWPPRKPLPTGDGGGLGSPRIPGE